MSEQSTALVVHTLAEAQELSRSLAPAKAILPRHVQDAPSALAIILAGQEMGLPPMLSLRSIHLVEGRPVIAAEMQLAIARRAGIRHRWIATTATAATIELSRAGEDSLSLSWTIEMAQAAGLATRGPWKAHPAAMLRARAITTAIRAYCPDVLSGVLEPDEAAEIRDRPTGTAALRPEVIEAEVIQPAPTPSPAHSEIWRTHAKSWCAKLREQSGLTYAEVADWREQALGLPRPSALATREDLAAALDQIGDGVEVREWQARVAADGGGE